MSGESDLPVDQLKDVSDSREKEFGKTVKLEGLLFGRETFGQGKKRIGQGGTKVPHHKRTRTELPQTKTQFIDKFKYKESDDRVIS